MLSLAFHTGSLLGSRYDPNNGWSLGITVLVGLQGVTSLTKPEKPQNTLDRKIWKTAIKVDKNRKPKTELEKTRKPHMTPKPKNHSF